MSNISPQNAKDTLRCLMLKFHGMPYRWGGDDTIEGFDCSGGVLEMLMSIGLWPHGQDATAQMIFDVFNNPKKAINLQKPPMGSLVWFGQPGKITHIGMVWADDIMFEFGGGGSKTKTADDAVKQNAYGRFRPISNRSDLVAIMTPLLLAS